MDNVRAYQGLLLHAKINARGIMQNSSPYDPKKTTRNGMGDVKQMKRIIIKYRKNRA